MTTPRDRITPATLAALLTSAEPHAVLDVRERGAYERGHIFRTTALPRRWLEFRLAWNYAREESAGRFPLSVSNRTESRGRPATLRKPA